MTRKETEDIREYLMRETRVWGGNITVFENGMFEIVNIDEHEVNYIYSILMRDENICDLYRSHKYDFSRFDYRLMPKVKYTITGQFRKGGSL